MLRDETGLAVSGATGEAIAPYCRALGELQSFTGDPVASVNAVLEAAPGFIMAHVLKGYLYGLSTEKAAQPVTLECAQAASALAGTSREAGHAAALQALAEGRWHRAGALLEDLAIEHPRDALALQAGHQIDFFTGNARLLRDRIARALPAWDETMPGFHAVLGMHAFGLEENGDYARAEAQGRRAVELNPRDGWAQHAVAHVMEMQSRQKDGIAWMRDNAANWSSGLLQTHNWWHLALYHYELGEHEAVLSIYDGPIYGARSKLALNLVDASAILWRLELAGIDTGGRWRELAENWLPHAQAGNYAFNDAHAMMAFVGAGWRDAQLALLATQEEAAAKDDDNGAFTREVGRPVCLALAAFGDGDHAGAVAMLKPVRAVAYRFGGSHAQRDFVDLTLIEAAIRSGRSALARALAAERHELKPESPLSALLRRRAAGIAVEVPKVNAFTN